MKHNPPTYPFTRVKTPHLAHHLVISCVFTVFEGLQNVTLHAHVESNAFITGCLDCGKPYEQVTAQKVSDYLNQTSEPWEQVMDRVLKHDTILDGLQRGVSTLIPPRVSQAPACNGPVYKVNFDNPQSGTQTKQLPLFEDFETSKKVKCNCWTSCPLPLEYLRKTNLRIFSFLETYFILLMSKIQFFSKSGESNFNGDLQYLTSGQILYWNLIVQNN